MSFLAMWLWVSFFGIVSVHAHKCNPVSEHVYVGVALCFV